MHPEFLKFGSLTIRFYGIFVAIGFLSAYWLFQKRAKKIGLTDQSASNLLILLFASGILGARTYYVVQNWNVHFGGGLSFSQHPVEALMIQRGGLVFFGGFIAAVGSLLIWAKLHKQALAPLMDALAAPLAIGHAFGRLGCFMNGCCYGKVCTQAWAVTFPPPHEMAGLPIHPTQLYEAAGLFYLVFVLGVIERMARYPGSVACTYAILYSILRFSVEIFRGDVPHTYLGHFTLAQVIAMIIFVVAWAISSRLAFVAARERIRQARAAVVKTAG